MLRCVAWLALIWTSVAIAQDRPGDNATAARIADGVEKVNAGKLLEAIEQFQRVLDTAGDELVPVNGRQHAPARAVVHGHLSRLPADGLKLYRQRLDGQASNRLAEATKSRDDAPLRKLVGDMFCTSASELAILELSRRAFERADLDGAEYWLRHLLPGDDDRLHYPAPKTEPPAVIARLAVIDLFRGERASAEQWVKQLREQHPKAAGLLAGKNGPYVDTLTELLARPEQTTLAPPRTIKDWPTLGGSVSRDGGVGEALPYFWPDVPDWKRTLPVVGDPKKDESLDPAQAPPLPLYPIVSGGLAYVSDGSRVFTINLSTGELASAHWAKNVGLVSPAGKREVRHTLTAADGIIYARLGSVALRTEDRPGSYLVAFARKPNEAEHEYLWQLTPPSADGATTHFEGAPIVHQGRLYVGVWRQPGGEAMASVACYRIGDPRLAPELLWQRPIGKAAMGPLGEARFKHELLTISGNSVIACTHAGAVVALDAESGRPVWEHRYPRNDRAATLAVRDLCPAVAHGGLIFAAPGDTDRVLCLEQRTGRLVWEREGIDVVHLLGVAKNRLIATVGGQVKGIRGLHVFTGADSGELGWTRHEDGGQSTYGRGLVTADAIIWPTRTNLQFLRPEDGTPLRAPIPGTFGNLVYADGCLLVATTNGVLGYPSAARKLRDGNAPAGPQGKARGLIDAGRLDEATRALDVQREDDGALRWHLAERWLRMGNVEKAREQYRRLVSNPSRVRSAALVRLAELASDRPAQDSAWNEARQSSGTIRDEHGAPWAIDRYVDHRRNAPPAPLPARSENRVVAGNALFTLASEQAHHEPGIGLTNDSPIAQVGGQLRDFPSGTSQVCSFAPQSFGPNWVAGTEAIVAFSEPKARVVFDGHGVPVLGKLDRPTLPSASGSEQPEPIHSVVDPTTYAHGRRLIHGHRVFEAPLAIAGPIAVGERCCVTRLSDGRLFVAGPDAQARIIPRKYVAWNEAPLHLGDDRFVLASNSGLEVFNAISAQHGDSYAVRRVGGRSGEPLRMRRVGDRLLVIVPLNHGVEVDCLNVGDLKRAWTSESIFAGSRIGDVVVQGSKLIVSRRSELVAFDWTTGKPAWQSPLPESHDLWRLRTSSVGVVAFPASMSEPEVLDAGPLVGLLRAARKSYDFQTSRELPLLVFDEAQGALVQLFNFPAVGSAVGVTVDTGSIVVVTGKGCWSLLAR